MDQIIAMNRRGKPMTCKVMTTPLPGTVKEVCRVISMMDEQAVASTVTN